MTPPATRTASPRSRRHRHSILMVASEALPFSKTGGLADVASALPAALGRLGHDVTLVTPRYKGVQPGDRREAIEVNLGSRQFALDLSERTMADRVRAVLVGSEELYEREGLYGIGHIDYLDNAVRFAVLARAALNLCRRGQLKPTVIHAHDWQTGLVPVYQRHHPDYAELREVPSVFTIHNLAYQGLFTPEWMARVDITGDLFTVNGLEYWNQVSYLKGGINFSTYITTVSRKYAEEIQTPEFGSGFEGIIQRRRADLFGILNGVDTETWDPGHDPALPEPYSATSLKGKAAAKREVLGAMGLDASAIGKLPLIGMISRLVDQKGFDLVAQAADELVALDAAFVVLGTGEPKYQDLWRTLAARYPDRIGSRIGFDERLAHLIEGGADMFLMPSRFEPCGLNQMYSLRYGTVPIVRATGGLDDTVQDVDETARGGTGFKFREYSASAMMHAVKRALDLYRQPRRWKALQGAGMKKDYSWDVSAREYVKLYDRQMGTS